MVHLRIWDVFLDRRSEWRGLPAQGFGARSNRPPDYISPKPLNPKRARQSQSAGWSLLAWQEREMSALDSSNKKGPFVMGNYCGQSYASVLNHLGDLSGTCCVLIVGC